MSLSRVTKHQIVMHINVNWTEGDIDNIDAECCS